MKSKELRIGNIVKCTGHLPIGFNSHKLLFAEVREIRRDSIETRSGFYKYEDIGPIELSEKIIVRCEFEPKEHDNTSTVLYSLGDFALYKDDDGFGIDFGCTEINFFKNVRLKYLHELQNLYFDLTGKDLYVTLDENMLR